MRVYFIDYLTVYRECEFQLLERIKNLWICSMGAIIINVRNNNNFNLERI